jgi:hypothetical protein
VLRAAGSGGGRPKATQRLLADATAKDRVGNGSRLKHDVMWLNVVWIGEARAFPHGHTHPLLTTDKRAFSPLTESVPASWIGEFSKP